MQPNDTHTDRNWDSAGRLIPAVVLIGVGSLFLLGNLHIIPSMNWFDFWPVILIVIGALKLADAPRTGGFAGGAIMLGIGGLFLASNLGVLPFAVWDLWPLILIVVGVSLLIQRAAPGFSDSWRGRARDSWPSGSATVAAGDLNLTAVFSGGKRKVTTEDFRGGVVSAGFCGFELDLRVARMRADSAVVRIDAVFGGVELKIPETWCAVVQGAGIFGGYSDETRHPVMTPETKRLIVKGGAVFGGVVVKN